MSKVTHCRVKFIEDNAVAIVNTHDIKEFRNKAPQDELDFKVDYIYTCYWTDDKNDQVPLPVQISELACKHIIYNYISGHI